MAKVFVSYSSAAQDAVALLVADIKKLRHSVWFDEDIGTGQVWWDRILAEIRACDIFVCAIEPAALRSIACTREREYAAALGKPILPIFVAEGMSTTLLPGDVAKLQVLQYRKQDSESALHLAAGIANIGPPSPLPDPLPQPPEAPFSHLSALAGKVGAAELPYTQQKALVAELRDHLQAARTQADRDDIAAILERLKSRADTAKSVVEDINDLLERMRKAAAEAATGAISPIREEARGLWRWRRTRVLMLVVACLSAGFASVQYYLNQRPTVHLRVKGAIDMEVLTVLVAKLKELGYHVPAPEYLENVRLANEYEPPNGWAYVTYFRAEDEYRALQLTEVLRSNLANFDCAVDGGSTLRGRNDTKTLYLEADLRVKVCRTRGATPR